MWYRSLKWKQDFRQPVWFGYTIRTRLRPQLAVTVSPSTFFPAWYFSSWPHPIFQLCFKPFETGASISKTCSSTWVFSVENNIPMAPSWMLRSWILVPALRSCLPRAHHLTALLQASRHLENEVAVVMDYLIFLKSLEEGKLIFISNINCLFIFVSGFYVWLLKRNFS